MDNVYFEPRTWILQDASHCSCDKPLNNLRRLRQMQNAFYGTSHVHENVILKSFRARLDFMFHFLFKADSCQFFVAVTLLAYVDCVLWDYLSVMFTYTTKPPVILALISFSPSIIFTQLKYDHALLLCETGTGIGMLWSCDQQFTLKIG